MGTNTNVMQEYKYISREVVSKHLQFSPFPDFDRVVLWDGDGSR